MNKRFKNLIRNQQIHNLKTWNHPFCDISLLQGLNFVTNCKADLNSEYPRALACNIAKEWEGFVLYMDLNRSLESRVVLQDNMIVCRPDSFEEMLELYNALKSSVDLIILDEIKFEYSRQLVTGILATGDAPFILGFGALSKKVDTAVSKISYTKGNTLKLASGLKGRKYTAVQNGIIIPEFVFPTGISNGYRIAIQLKLNNQPFVKNDIKAGTFWKFVQEWDKNERE